MGPQPTTLILAALVVVAGCGEGEQPAPSAPSRTPGAQQPAATAARAPAAAASGTRIVVRDSEFGRMLFDARNQAIYIFQRDPKGNSVCYGECAAAWPPVYTKGRPRAGQGVRSSLLGTIRRQDGRRQVTYAGKPLYYYVHEDPGEVRCHNVNLNGGLWWVVGPNGRRRP